MCLTDEKYNADCAVYSTSPSTITGSRPAGRGRPARRAWRTA
jgi:hypothetical protein